MKKIILLVIILIAAREVMANHTKGGWIYYEYLGPGLQNPNANRYLITLKVYMICNPTPQQLDQTAALSFFDAGTFQLLQTISAPLVANPNIQNNPGSNPCIINPPTICYKIATYQTTVELVPNAAGYTIAYQRCCRISGIANIVSPSNIVGATYTVNIPGTNVGQNATHNSSPQFVQNDTAIVCENNYFIFDFSAVDPDGDSLVYSLCDAYAGGSSNAPMPNPASNPPYSSIPYSAGYSGSFPLGIQVSIDPRTGLVSGIAPGNGEYVVNACVTEYRNGVPIAEARKELHLFVADCNPLKALLNPSYEFCDDFLVTFQNNATNPAGSVYYWDFGVPGITTDVDTVTSANGTVQYQYADTGRYIVKLKVVLNGVCSDSSTTIANVYPGFFPGFRWTPACKNSPFSFFDTSRTRYGVVNYWRWDFGDLTSNADTSRLQHPQYIYPAAGTYQVSLTVGTDKGCIKTIQFPVTVFENPILNTMNDTLICDIDTLKLFSFANVPGGTYTWTSSPPNYGFYGSNLGPTPSVTPDDSAYYYVFFDAGLGCTARDTIHVAVKKFVTILPFSDTTICLTDTIIPKTNSDALYYQWTANPAAQITTDQDKFPVIKPLTAGVTNINVVGNIGLCQSNASFNITAVPYPVAIAGPGGTICEGDNIQLSVTHGDRYVWTPTRGLNDPRIQNPIATPPFSTDYIVQVFENNGCPKPGKDTVSVIVIPHVIPSATHDTSVVIGEPLQLFAAGANNATWTASSSPSWLNNPNILNPVAIIGADIGSITYYVRIFTNEGCEAFDTVKVKIFKTKPDIFVPSVFTPNNNGTNDVFRPIPVGIKKLNFFRVFNRRGKLMFSTNRLLHGWDGTYNGQDQEPVTYVWEVDAETYTGEHIYKKGYMVLLR